MLLRLIDLFRRQCILRHKADHSDYRAFSSVQGNSDVEILLSLRSMRQIAGFISEIMYTLFGVPIVPQCSLDSLQCLHLEMSNDIVHSIYSFVDCVDDFSGSSGTAALGISRSEVRAALLFLYNIPVLLRQDAENFCKQIHLLKYVCSNRPFSDLLSDLACPVGPDIDDVRNRNIHILLTTHILSNPGLFLEDGFHDIDPDNIITSQYAALKKRHCRAISMLLSGLCQSPQCLQGWNLFCDLSIERQQCVVDQLGEWFVIDEFASSLLTELTYSPTLATEVLTHFGATACQNRGEILLQSLDSKFISGDIFNFFECCLLTWRRLRKRSADIEEAAAPYQHHLALNVDKYDGWGDSLADSTNVQCMLSFFPHSLRVFICTVLDTIATKNVFMSTIRQSIFSLKSCLHPSSMQSDSISRVCISNALVLYNLAREHPKKSSARQKLFADCLNCLHQGE